MHIEQSLCSQFNRSSDKVVDAGHWFNNRKHRTIERQLSYFWNWACITKQRQINLFFRKVKARRRFRHMMTCLAASIAYIFSKHWIWQIALTHAFVCKTFNNYYFIMFTGGKILHWSTYKGCILKAIPDIPLPYISPKPWDTIIMKNHIEEGTSVKIFKKALKYYIWRTFQQETPHY